MNRADRIRRTREDRGSQLVELAVVFVLLALLVAGVWDLGRMFRGYITIANAARDGARYAIRLPCQPTNATQRAALKTAIQDAVIAEAAGSGITLTSANITIQPDPVNTGCPTTGNRQYVVTVTYPHIMWMTGITGMGNFTLTARARMDWFGNDSG
ncbi:MAG: TadE family protein [Chloroflexota bacterium]|nr:TadE family protein [Chloroflexota bacterium]